MNNKNGHFKLNNQKKKKIILKMIDRGANKLKNAVFIFVSRVPIKKS
tara:strand:- start:539 stop:679 length:141 start_codon:yes stop_codon:yes gene_type:complete